MNKAQAARQPKDIAAPAAPSAAAPAAEEPVGVTQALQQKGIAADASSVEAVYACTPLQAGMLTQTLVSANGTLYVHRHCIRPAAATGPARLRTAWRQVVAATDILRTAFFHHLTSVDSP